MSEKLDSFLTEFPTTVNQDVTWGEMDAFGHINNTVYFRYFETVRMNFFEKSGVNAHNTATQVGPILASTQCQFRAPLTFPDNITIGTRIKELGAIEQGEKRFTMEYAVFSHSQDCVAAKGEGAIVYYDYAVNQSCAIPASILKNFKNI